MEPVRVSSEWGLKDYLGMVRVRLNLGRMDYSIRPGLYALNGPGPDSHVFVSANYKLSFDILRQNLAALSGWILVLDTKGINVWCAAGKGTFGTDELVRQVKESGLGERVSHRRLVVPQLGAPGVSAHEVREKTGFSVVYGPVRARDIGRFLDKGLKTDAEMRRVTFTLLDRLVLIPVELVAAVKYGLLLSACLFLLSGLNRAGYSTDLVMARGGAAAAAVLLAVLAGAVVTPLLLPWIPGRAFSVKGAIAGALVFIAWAMGREIAPLPLSSLGILSVALSSFLAMNFTGATAFTSLSGVLKEMRFSLPAQGIVAGTGLVLWIAGLFL